MSRRTVWRVSRQRAQVEHDVEAASAEHAAKLLVPDQLKAPGAVIDQGAAPAVDAEIARARVAPPAQAAPAAETAARIIAPSQPKSPAVVDLQVPGLRTVLPVGRASTQTLDAPNVVTRVAPQLAPVAQAAPAAPVVQAAPAAPVVQAAPAAPGVQAAPAAPVAQAAPAAPGAQAAPAAPVVQAAPAAPVVQAAPAAPVVQAAPAAPVVQAAPAAPVVQAAPAAPVVQAAPAAPVVQAAPAAPVVQAAPADAVVQAAPAAPVAQAAPDAVVQAAPADAAQAAPAETAAKPNAPSQPKSSATVVDDQAAVARTLAVAAGDAKPEPAPGTAAAGLVPRTQVAHPVEAAPDETTARLDLKHDDPPREPAQVVGPAGAVTPTSDDVLRIPAARRDGQAVVATNSDPAAETQMTTKPLGNIAVPRDTQMGDVSGLRSNAAGPQSMFPNADTTPDSKEEGVKGVPDDNLRASPNETAAMSLPVPVPTDGTTSSPVTISIGEVAAKPQETTIVYTITNSRTSPVDLLFVRCNALDRKGSIVGSVFDYVENIPAGEQIKRVVRMASTLDTAQQSFSCANDGTDQ